MTDEERFSPKRLLSLRRLTRAVADVLREQVVGYVGTLAPLLRPKAVLGAYAEGGTRDPAPGVDRAIRDLQSLHEQVATTKPFNLVRDLKFPLELLTAGLDVSPLEYSHVVKTGSSERVITVVSPLKWVLSYNGFEPGRLALATFTPRRMKEQLALGSRSNEELRKFVLHYLALHLSATRQPGVASVLRDLRFPLETLRIEDFGALPLTCVTSALPTLRPPDHVLVEHTEIAGTETFEEVLEAEEIPKLPDPLNKRLTEVARETGVEPAK
jgi:hypothetical protein